MSRIGKLPVPVPADVKVAVSGDQFSVKGPHGELSMEIPDKVRVAYNDQDREVVVTRPDDERSTRAFHGLIRALINNMVVGVKTPFEKRLEIQGTGYQATLAGKVLKLQVGYANTIELPLPEKVICEVPAPTQIIVRSVDKHAVGQFAANIRRVRPPEPYKGKGIRYVGEQVRRKEGKAAAGG
jgi:large subunit ribosomal protein L6